MPDIIPTLGERFGDAIRQRRRELGLSQEELADRASLHRTYVSLLERGRRTPTLTAVESLAIALETSMTALITESEARR